MTLFEVHEAASIIQEAADEEANIIFGTVIDPTMKDEIKVTVIATGFDSATKGFLNTRGEQLRRRHARAASRRVAGAFRSGRSRRQQIAAQHEVRRRRRRRRSEPRGRSTIRPFFAKDSAGPTAPADSGRWRRAISAMTSIFRR